MLKIQVKNNQRIYQEYICNVLEYSRIYLKYSNYVIASFEYPFNARVHTKYS